MRKLILKIVIFLLVLSTSAIITPIFSEIKKTIVAIPYFAIEGKINKSFAKPLTDTIITEFEKSGRIETKSSEDIKLMLKELDSIQAMGDCSASDACSKKIGRKMQVEYILQSRLSKLEDKYIIKIRLMNILAELEIAPLQKEVYLKEDILSTVRKMAKQLSLQFQLKGQITYVKNKSVYINLGRSHHIVKGDTFNVVKEKSIRNKKGKVIHTEKTKVGVIKILSVEDNSAKATIIKELDDIEENYFVIMIPKKRIEKKLIKRRILILDFVNQKKTTSANYLTVSIPEGFIPPLQRLKTFVVLNRSKSAKAVKHLKLKLSQLNNEENAIRLGKISDADVVIIGNFVTIGNSIQITAKAVDVITGRIQVSQTKVGKLDSSIFVTIEKMSNAMAIEMRRKLKPLSQKIREKVIIKEKIIFTPAINNTKVTEQSEKISVSKYISNSRFQFYMSGISNSPLGYIKDGFGYGIGLNLKITFKNILADGLLLGINTGFSSFISSSEKMKNYTIVPIQFLLGYQVIQFGYSTITPYLNAGIDIGELETSDTKMNYLLPDIGIGILSSHTLFKRLILFIDTSYSVQIDQGQNSFFNVGFGVGWKF